MSTDMKLHPIFKAFAYEKQSLQQRATQPGSLPFVTLSRQAGAGGHSLAHILAARMQEHSAVKEHDKELLEGWHVYDKNLVRMVAEDPRLNVSMEELFTERYHSRLNDLMRELRLQETSQDIVLPKIFRLIHNLASLGKAVLVGRGAPCLTRDLPLGVHIRLVSCLQARIERVEQRNIIDTKEARAWVQRHDKERAKLIKDHFGRDIEDPLLYDAVFNTDTLSLEQIADMIETMVLARVQAARPVA